MEPGSEYTCWIPNTELNMSVARDPTSFPDPPIPSNRNIDAARGIHRHTLTRLANHLVSIFENSTVESSVFTSVCGEASVRRSHGVFVNLVTLHEVFYVLRLEQVKTKAQTDHACDHGQRLIRTPGLFGRGVPLPLILLLPDLGESERLHGRVFPEVDPVSQPIEVSPAPAEPFDSIDDPQGGGKAGAMIAHHGSMIIVEARHGVELGWALSVRRRPILSDRWTGRQRFG